MVAVYQPDPNYINASLSDPATAEIEKILGFPLRFLITFDANGAIRSFIPSATKAIVGGLPIVFDGPASLELAQSITYVVYKQNPTTTGWWGWVGDKWVCRYYQAV
jgi:hypothetical protein